MPPSASAISSMQRKENRDGHFIAPSTSETTPSSARSITPRLSEILGWAGVGIGLIELLMPRRVAVITGLPSHSSLLRLMGTREMITSAGLLLQPHRSGWRWSRVAGDLLDLSVLAWAGQRQPQRRLTVLTALVAGMTALDVLAASDSRSPRRVRTSPGLVRIHKSLHIQRPPEVCYQFWRNFENFPQFMQHVEAVQAVDATRTHWRVKAPLGQHVDWTAELFSDIPSQQLAWRTLEGSAIEHTGVVRFLPSPNDKSTRLDIEMSYHAPFGKAGVVLAKIFGEEPSQQMDDDLRRFKQLIETGEIATTTGQSTGRRSPRVHLLPRRTRS